jgi:hypothetical protein
MTKLNRMIAILGALGALAGCVDRTVADDESLPPKPPDMGAPAESEGESDGGLVCHGRGTACDGKCMDFVAQDDHCGACGHACEQPSRFGHCLEGACPSVFRCSGFDQGIETCDDVCALHGQACDGSISSYGHGCGGASHDLYFGQDALAQCEARRGGDLTFGLDPTCTRLIDWSPEDAPEGGTAQAVACCCTQDPV